MGLFTWLVNVGPREQEQRYSVIPLLRCAHVYLFHEQVLLVTCPGLDAGFMELYWRGLCPTKGKCHLGGDTE